MNEITIPLKSNNLYYGIKRKLGVIHSQFRMQCSNLKSDLHSLHVVDDPVCICCNQIENCEHFFFSLLFVCISTRCFHAMLREICSVDITTNCCYLVVMNWTVMLTVKFLNLLNLTYIYESGRFVI